MQIDSGRQCDRATGSPELHFKARLRLAERSKAWQQPVHRESHTRIHPYYRLAATTTQKADFRGDGCQLVTHPSLQFHAFGGEFHLVCATFK
ncbi:hypothetical protein D3C84_860430 [compost metagenome]